MFDGGVQRGAYSDFAHLQDQATLSFVLSLGNDGADKEKLKEMKAASRRKKKAKESKIKEIEEANTGAGSGEKKIHQDCINPFCKELKEKLQKREDDIIEEREKIQKLIQDRSDELNQIEESVADMEMRSRIATDRARGIKDEIQQNKELADELEARTASMKAENQEMGHKIMTLELELQKQLFEARKAQADMIQAMWHKKDEGTSSRNAAHSNNDLPPITPIVTPRIRKPAYRNNTLPVGTLKYPGLVRPDLKDAIEVEKNVSDPYSIMPVSPSAYAQTTRRPHDNFLRTSTQQTFRRKLRSA